MGRGDSGSAGSVAVVVVAAAAAEVGLEREVRPDTVAPAGRMDRSDGTNRGMNGEGAHLEAEDFHLHHLHLQTLTLLNVYAWTEGYSVGIDLGRGLLVGKPGAVHSGSEGTLVGPVRDEDVLSLRVVVEFFINWLVAGEGGKAGDVEGSAWGGGVGHIGGSGADAAGAKTREEGSAVVLLGDGHLEGIGDGGLSVYLRVGVVESKRTGRERMGVRRQKGGCG